MGVRIWVDVVSNACERRMAIEESAEAILEARAMRSGLSLAEINDPCGMPSELRDAHVANDRAVDVAYGCGGDGLDESRVSFWLEMRGTILGAGQAGTHLVQGRDAARASSRWCRGA